MNRILFINPFGIGDVLFTTPVIHSVKARYRGCRICYWCNERIRDIFNHDPAIAGIFPLSRGDLKRLWRRSPFQATRSFIKLLKGLKKERFDIVFDFSLDYRYSLITALLGIKKRIGFNYKGRGRFLTDKIPLEGYHAKHMVEYYFELLKLADIPVKTRKLHIHVAQTEQAQARHLLSRAGVRFDKKLIGIAGGAGASWGRDAGMKHWPAVKFAQLADAISDAFNAQVVLLGDVSEKPIAEVITKMTRCDPVDLVGKTSLAEFAGVLTFLDLLITNDGGPLHMAVALGLKTVSIFGPVDERVYGPYPQTEEHQIITGSIDCRPCYRNFRMPVCGRERECIKSIGVNEVFEAARRLVG